MDNSHPYEPGEIITLRRFKFVPRRTPRGMRVIPLHAHSEVVSVRVTSHWKLHSGVDQYTGVPAQPHGTVAIWLKRKAAQLDQRIFFVKADVFSKAKKRPVDADDYSVLSL